MNANRSLLLAVLTVLLVPVCKATDDPLAIVRTFLPPGAQLGELIEADPHTGQTKTRRPALLTAHILSPKSHDIVFAYYTQASDLPSKILFISVLHGFDSGYSKIFESSYFGQLLWMQDFRTVGLQAWRLPGEEKDSIALITGVGAALGATLKVLRWDSTWGLIDVMPEHTAAYKILLTETKNDTRVTLSFEKYPGEKGAPPLVAYHWNGKNFVRAK